MRHLCLILIFSLVPLGALADNPRLVLHTTRGDILIELYPDKAPLTVENFLAYAREGFYDGTVFHRVIRNFVIQGGGFTSDFTQKATKAPIANESRNRLRNERWTIAMARTADPDSATSQFYINLRMNLSLDYKPRTPGYTVFGQVIDGKNVVSDISKAETGVVAGMPDVPLEPIILNSVEILSQ